jgi:hypothetical protein
MSTNTSEGDDDDHWSAGFANGGRLCWRGCSYPTECLGAADLRHALRVLEEDLISSSSAE